MCLTDRSRSRALAVLQPVADKKNYRPRGSSIPLENRQPRVRRAILGILPTQTVLYTCPNIADPTSSTWLSNVRTSLRIRLGSILGSGEVQTGSILGDLNQRHTDLHCSSRQLVLDPEIGPFPARERRGSAAANLSLLASGSLVDTASRGMGPATPYSYQYTSIYESITQEPHVQ